MIGNLIESIRKDLAALDTEVSATHSPLIHLAVALDELRTARAELNMVERSLQAAVIEAMGDRWEATIEGFGGIKVRGGKKRTTWRNEELWPLALRRARSVRTAAAGEADERLLEVVRAVVQPSYWRTGELKRWGVDPDDYCNVTTGSKSVEIIR